MADYGHWWYTKGKDFKCYNNSTGWFGHVRDHKPHIFRFRGEWHVVYAGVHHDDWLRERIADRNNVAHYWCSMQNKTPEQRKEWHYRLHLGMLARKQQECQVKDLARKIKLEVYKKRREGTPLNAEEEQIYANRFER